MSIAIGHFAVGTSVTMVAYQMLPLRVRMKLRIAQFFIFALGGLWAMLPDLSKFAGTMYHLNDNYWMKIELFKGTVLSDFTVIINRIEALHESNWANIFFLHRLIDIVDKNDRLWISGILIFVMISIAAFYTVREIVESRTSR
ncbi:hypothetical protein ACFLXP_00405 [Chloroflexota bacterium]